MSVQSLNVLIRQMQIDPLNLRITVTLIISISYLFWSLSLKTTQKLTTSYYEKSVHSFTGRISQLIKTGTLYQPD